MDSDTFKVVDGKFVCVECEKPFSQKKLLNRHVRTVHAQENPHTCQQCGRRCRSRSELETHLLIHSGSKPHKCNLCQPKDKAFAQKSQLIDHQVKVHKLSDPYTGKPTNCQVWPLNSIFLSVSFFQKDIDLPREQINDSPVGNGTFLFLSSQKLPCLCLGCVASGTAEKKGHDQVCCKRRGGSRTPSKTADANLDCAFVENALSYTHPCEESTE